MDFELNYKIEMTENKDILLYINIKNISNKSKQIQVTLTNSDENNGKIFIVIGISRQSYIIREREVININYTLIPNGRGEYIFPVVKIVEKEFLTKEKISSNYYFLEKLAII